MQVHYILFFQLSGNIYGIYITEDYCSKTLRLCESCHLLSEEELLHITSNIQLWLNLDYDKLRCIWKSDATQAILFALDNEFNKRLSNLSPETQWRLAIIFCKLQKLFRDINERENKSEFLSNLFVSKFIYIINSEHGISEMSREEFILLMCMASVLNLEKLALGHGDRLQQLLQMKILTVFESIDSNELTLCYSAIKRLNPKKMKFLEEKISEKYGFRFRFVVTQLFYFAQDILKTILRSDSIIWRSIIRNIETTGYCIFERSRAACNCESPYLSLEYI